MNCEDFGKYLDNYESLTEQEKTDMDEHAAKCEACKSELDFFLLMLSSMKSLPKIEPPSDFMDKLNSRLDAEDKRVVPASGIMGHLKRYGMRYAAAAACLALVAVITANRAMFTDTMNNLPGGVIQEETIVSDGSAQSEGQNDAEAADESPAVQTDGTQTDAAATDSNGTAAPKQNSGTKSSTAGNTTAKANTSENAAFTSTASSRRFVPDSTAAEMSREAVNVPVSEKAETSAVAAASANEQISSTEPATMNISAETSTPIETRSVMNADEAYSISSHDEGHGIALASIVNDHDTTKTYDLRAEEVSESLKASQVRANYSLAGDNDIAHGRYYKLNKDGIPIESATAVGSIKFKSDDEERALEVINHYAVDERDNVYTTDSVNLTLILSKLRSEGIPYRDYTIGESGEVKFQVQFNN